MIMIPAEAAGYPAMPPRLREAVAMLSDALAYARELHRDPWDFAVEIATLVRTGATANDLRWLVCHGLVAHGAEVTGPDDEGRTFRLDRSLRFEEATCFILTERGIALMSGRTTEADLEPHPESPPSPLPPHGPEASNLIPRWMADRQELFLGRVLVKRFKVPAPNQVLILAVLEEERWPPRIDDPLPPQPEVNTKRRLHDTINALNRRQTAPLLRFTGDGRGQGICWELRGL